MMNKKLIALLIAVSTISATMFALFDDVFRGTGRVAEGVVSAPADVATGGRTWEERHDRYEEEDEARDERRGTRRRQRVEERRQRRADRRNDRYND